jgi:hypothetical protein
MDQISILNTLLQCFLSGKILILVFLLFYLFGIIPLYVPFFAVLDICKGMGAWGSSSPLTSLHHIWVVSNDDYK